MLPRRPRGRIRRGRTRAPVGPGIPEACGDRMRLEDLCLRRSAPRALDKTSASVVRQARKECRVDALAAVAEIAALDAFAHEAGPLEHALRGDVADAHDRVDTVDAVRE